MDTKSTLLNNLKKVATTLIQNELKEADSSDVFKTKGEMIYLVGHFNTQDVDLDRDYHVQKVMLAALRKDLITSLQEVGSMGIAGALLRAAKPNGFGFDITTDSDMEENEFLFTDIGTCAVITVPMDNDEELVHYLFDQQVPIMTLGHVTKGDLRIDDISYGHISQF